MTNFAHRDTIEIESARYQIYDTKTQKTNLDISVHIWYYYLLVLHRMHVENMKLFVTNFVLNKANLA